MPLLYLDVPSTRCHLYVGSPVFRTRATIETLWISYDLTQLWRNTDSVLVCCVEKPISKHKKWCYTQHIRERTLFKLRQISDAKQSFLEIFRGGVSKHHYSRKPPKISWIFAFLHQNNDIFSIRRILEIHKMNVESRSKLFRLVLNFQRSL